MSNSVQVEITTPMPYSQVSTGYYLVTSGGGYQNRAVMSQGNGANMAVVDDPSDITGINAAKNDLQYVPVKRITITVNP